MSDTEMNAEQSRDKRPGGSPPPSAVRPQQKSRTGEDDLDWEEQEEQEEHFEAFKKKEDKFEVLLRELLSLRQDFQGMKADLVEIKEGMGGKLEQFEARLLASDIRVEEGVSKLAAMKVEVDKFSGQVKEVRVGLKRAEEVAEAAMKAAAEAGAKVKVLEGLNEALKKSHEALEMLCATMSTQMADMKPQEGRTFAEAVGGGGDEPMPQSHASHGGAARTVEQALREEQREHGCSLKLKGFVSEQLRGLPLLKAVREKLSDMVGTPITVSAAVPILKGKVGPCVKVQLGSFEEFLAVWRLGKRGTGSKLGADQRMWQWFGRVEMAVRSQLYEEAKGKEDVWVARSSLKKREDGTVKSLPLSAAALAKGLEAIHTSHAQRA